MFPFYLTLSTCVKKISPVLFLFDPPKIGQLFWPTSALIDQLFWCHLDTAYGKFNFKGHFPQRPLEPSAFIFLPCKFCLISLKYSSNSTSSGKHLLTTFPFHVEFIHVLSLLHASCAGHSSPPWHLSSYRGVIVSARGGVSWGERTVLVSLCLE